MDKCNLCQDATDFHPGLRGRNADSTKLLVVMHKPDSRISVPILISEIDPYVSALLNSRTGENLTRLLGACGLGLEDVYLTNVFKCVLSGNREPNQEEYSACLHNLEEQINEFQPRSIITSGGIPYSLLSRNAIGKKHYSNSQGEIRKHNTGTPMLVLPHFSALCVPMASQWEEKRNFEAAQKFVKKYVNSSRSLF